MPGVDPWTRQREGAKIENRKSRRNNVVSRHLNTNYRGQCNLGQNGNMKCHHETEAFPSRGAGFLQRGGVVEDLLVDFRQDSGVSAQSWGDVFTAQEEANGSFEECFQLVTINELGEGGHICCR